MASLSDHCTHCNRGDRDRSGAVRHEAWCPMFMRGPDAGGDPADWTALPFSEWETGLVTIGGQTFSAKQPTYIAGDGYADGGTPYSAEELERYNRSEER